MCQEPRQISAAHIWGLAPLTEAVEALSAGQGRVIVALDGRCASGKTTLAAELAKRYGWSVVHMDHFFLRPEQRTLERYARGRAFCLYVKTFLSQKT